MPIKYLTITQSLKMASKHQAMVADRLVYSRELKYLISLFPNNKIS